MCSGLGACCNKSAVRTALTPEAPHSRCWRRCMCTPWLTPMPLLVLLLLLLVLLLPVVVVVWGSRQQA